MCRNIKPLYHFEPPVTQEEIQAAALQYVRKVSGFQKPSKANQDAFQQAVEAITLATSHLLDTLQSDTDPRSREEWIQKAKARSEQRFARG